MMAVGGRPALDSPGIVLKTMTRPTPEVECSLNAIYWSTYEEFLVIRNSVSRNFILICENSAVLNALLYKISSSKDG